MKIVKESVSKKEKARMLDLLRRQKEEPKEKKYDGSVDVWATETEYERVIAAVRGVQTGYKTFMKESLENFKELSELKFPHVEDEAPKKWITYQLEEPVKEALIKEAGRSRLDLKDFVRAIVWTASNNQIKIAKEKEERQRKARDLNNGKSITFRLSGKLLERYKNQHGQVIEHEVAELVLGLLDKELK